VKQGIADTSVFVVQETGRDLGELPEKIAVSVITAAELELGVLRAHDTETRSRRLATLSRVRSAYRLLPIDEKTSSCFARIAAQELDAGRKLRRHDAWIAATALRYGVPVVTQDADFSVFSSVAVVRV
jgi:predicted nucleic acid-binding protein